MQLIVILIVMVCIRTHTHTHIIYIFARGFTSEHWEICSISEALKRIFSHERWCVLRANMSLAPIKGRRSRIYASVTTSHDTEMGSNVNQHLWQMTFMTLIQQDL